jgi:8-oxo-dGTP diphosphatase
LPESEHSEAAMEHVETSFRRVTWVLVENYRVLFVRKKDTPVFFDPGCRVEEGKGEEKILAQKIKEDLGVEIDLGEIHKLTSFAAQAYGKPEETMAQFAYYMAPYRGELRLGGELENGEMRFVSYEDQIDLTEGGQALRQYLRDYEGLI